jgi:hypothetical protein
VQRAAGFEGKRASGKLHARYSEAVEGRWLDLSAGAARAIGLRGIGVVHIEMSELRML